MGCTAPLTRCHPPDCWLERSSTLSSVWLRPRAVRSGVGALFGTSFGTRTLGRGGGCVQGCAVVGACGGLGG
eukprot:2865825-Prymnesium_polylepis.1